jgi:predicted ATP-dependent endonuclease of OLD family
VSLKRLVVCSVRGIPRSWPELEIGDKGLVTYGGNGVGKSSIVDALEFALSSRSSLYPVHRQQVNWDTGAPHVRDGASDISVEIAIGGQTVSFAPQQDPSELREDQREWVTTAHKATYVLRRHMLLHFIVEEPRSRYVLLEPFMNLAAYKAVEDALTRRASQPASQKKPRAGWPGLINATPNRL